MAGQPCVLGKSIGINGTISGEEDLVIEGRVEGKINLASHLHVQASAIVQADVDVADLTVDGTLRGDVQASNAVVLRANAQVVGNVQAAKLTIDEGASFSGRIQMDVTLPEGLGD